MKKHSPITRLSMTVFIIAIAAAVSSAYLYVRRTYMSPSLITSNNIEVNPYWISYDADHVVVEFDVAGPVHTPDGDYTDCPVGKGIVTDVAGKEISGVVDTSCRPEGNSKYAVTQFIYGDFKDKIPKKLNVRIGDLVFFSPKENKEVYVPVVKTVIFDLPDQPASDITTYPHDKVQASSGIDLIVKKAEFTPRVIKVSACLTLRDDGDWGLDAQVIMNGQTIPMNYWAIPNYRDPNAFNSNKRCFTAFFTNVVDFRTVEPGKISFVVEKVYRNMPDCVDSAGFDKIKDELAKYGIEPQPDAGGTYCFSGDIQAKASPEVNAHLYNYIKEALKEEVLGPLKIVIK